MAVGADIVARVATWTIVTWSLPNGPKVPLVPIEPQDVLFLIMAGFLAALGRIFMTAADMAEDQAGIV